MTIDFKKLLPPFILLAAALGFWMADGYSPTPVRKDSESKGQSDTIKKEVSSNNGLLFKGSEPNAMPIKMLATWETDFGLMSLFKPPYSEGVDGFYYDSKTKEMDGMMVMWESVAILILAGAAYLMSMKDKMSLEKLKENSDKD